MDKEEIQDFLIINFINLPWNSGIHISIMVCSGTTGFSIFAATAIFTISNTDQNYLCSSLYDTTTYLPCLTRE